MRRLLAQLVLLIGLLTLTPGWCGALEVTLQRIDANGIGESIGSVTAQDTDQGLVIYPDLAGLSPGEHGFHLHSTGSCEVGQTAEGTLLPAWLPEVTGTLMKRVNTSAPSETVTGAISAGWWWMTTARPTPAWWRHGSAQLT